MLGFDARMEPAAKFEMDVIARLKQQGWQAFSFGQSQLPLECRQHLRKFQDSSGRPALIRWMPDIITFREFENNQSYVALIDAKVCNGRPNFAIEMSAIETAEIYVNYLFTPTFFVFDDWQVLTPRDARQRGMRGPESNNGSGTPYMLIAKKYGCPFDEIFPSIQKV